MSDDQLYHLLVTGSVVCVTLSSIGCIFNIITTICFNKSDPIMGKMVIYLSLADLVSSIPVIPGLEAAMSSNIICQSITFLLNAGYGSSLCMTCCFAHALYVIIRSDAQNLVNYLRFYQITTVGVGSIIGTLAIFTGMNEIRGDQCRSSQPGPGTDWSLLVVIAIPTFVSVICCGIIYILFIRQIRELGARTNIGLMLYPAILVVCYVPYLIAEYLPNSPAWLIFMSTMLGNSQGLLNSLAYGLSKDILTAYRNKFCRKRQDEPPKNLKGSFEVMEVKHRASVVEVYGLT